jgi:hypothetical protein
MAGGLFGGGSDDATLPIGYATLVRVEDGSLKATINFVDEKANPIAEKVYQGFLQGSLRAVSVGWDAGQATYDEASDTLVLEQNTLIEISAVALPANPEAVKQAAALFDDLRTRKGSAMNKVSKALDLMSGATDAEVSERIKSLNSTEQVHQDLLSSIGATSAAEAVGIVAALKASADHVTKLQAQVDALLQEKTEAEFAKVIDEARKAGKFVASNEAGLVAASKGDVETLKAIVAHLHPVVNMATAVTPVASGSMLSKRQKALCARLGYDESEFASRIHQFNLAGEGEESGEE